MSVLVTGASGCIGRAVIAALNDAGYTPVSTGTSAPENPSIRHIEWDIRTPAGDRFAGENITAVVHTAAANGEGVSAKAAHSVNVQGTRNVLDAFPKARVIYLSCAEVYDPRRGYQDAYEEYGPAEPEHFTTEYERSKVEAENVVTRLRPDALVLRPAPVYGPGDRRNFPFLSARATKKGVLELPGGLKQEVSLASSGNVAAAVLAGLKNSGVGGVINVADPEPYVLREAINTYMAREGMEPYMFSEHPVDLAQLRAWAREKMGRRASASKGRKKLSRYAVRRVSQTRTLNLSRLDTVLGAQTQQDLAPREL